VTMSQCPNAAANARRIAARTRSARTKATAGRAATASASPG
jgi:hypothetical protein